MGKNLSNRQSTRVVERAAACLPWMMTNYHDGVDGDDGDDAVNIDDVYDYHPLHNQ